MTADPQMLLTVIRFEQERERHAVATDRLLRGGWDMPAATPGRIRRL